jgi:tubulin--tyrosine ligase-like protein 12
MHYTMGPYGSVWYVQDEVGSAISHSDSPNVKCMPFLHSPNNSVTDTHTCGFNVVWPVKKTAVNEIVYRDYLNGFSEKEFRSTRLHVWFDTPEDYFTSQLKMLRSG